MKRLKEPSTWAGFAALLQVAGAFLPAYTPIFHVLTVAAGSLAAAIPEAAKE